MLRLRSDKMLYTSRAAEAARLSVSYGDCCSAKESSPFQGVPHLTGLSCTG